MFNQDMKIRDSLHFAQLKSNLDTFVLFIESKFTPLINNALNSALPLIRRWMRMHNHVYMDRESATLESFKLDLQQILNFLCKINSSIFNYTYSNRVTISRCWALKFIEFLNFYYTSEVKCDHCGRHVPILLLGVSYILIEITHYMKEFTLFHDVNIDGLLEYHVHLYGLLYDIFNTKFISNYQKMFHMNFLEEDISLIKKMKAINDHS
ncbi:hypothetical protein MXB_338 [Myxobolus squamalis]|nr:hypothetical protein MXB_338 [Myxobolus squamalis]